MPNPIPPKPVPRLFSNNDVCLLISAGVCKSTGGAIETGGGGVIAGVGGAIETGGGIDATLLLVIPCGVTTVPTLPNDPKVDGDVKETGGEDGGVKETGGSAMGAASGIWPDCSVKMASGICCMGSGVGASATGAAKSIAGIVGSNDGGADSDPMLGTKGLKSPPNSGINISPDLPLKFMFCINCKGSN